MGLLWLPLCWALLWADVVQGQNTIAEFLLDSPHGLVDLRADSGTELQTLAQVTAMPSSPLARGEEGKDTPSDDPKSTREGVSRGEDSPKLAVLDQSVLEDVVANAETDTSSCVKHTTEFKCIVDMACGWCLQPKGNGQCVPGSYVGPLKDVKETVYCPVYTTYQVYIPPDAPSSDDAFGNMMKASQDKSSSSFNFDADLLFRPIDLTENLDRDVFDLPRPDIRNDYGHLDTSTPSTDADADKEDVATSADKADALKVEDDVTSKLLPGGAKPRRPLPVEPHSFFGVPQIKHDSPGFDRTVSPCGLPGVPQEFCDAWLKTHCGPDQLTDENIMNMKAANNPYDWCKLLFENQPGISLPEVDVFPWMINGKEVDLSEALRDKIRFGHALAGQGIKLTPDVSATLLRGGTGESQYHLTRPRPPPPATTAPVPE